MIRSNHPGTQILDSNCLGAWRVGFLDFSWLAAWASWTDILYWALLSGLGFALEKQIPYRVRGSIMFAWWQIWDEVEPQFGGL